MKKPLLSELSLRGAMLRSVGSRWAWFHEVDRPNRACTVMLGRQYSDDPDKLLAMNIADMKDGLTVNKGEFR